MGTLFSFCFWRKALSAMKNAARFECFQLFQHASWWSGSAGYQYASTDVHSPQEEWRLQRHMNNTLLEISAIQHEGQRAVGGRSTFWFQEIFCTLPLPSLEWSQLCLRSVCHQPWLNQRSLRAANLWETRSSEEITGSYETVGKHSRKTVWVGACGSGVKKVSGLGQQAGYLEGLGEGAGEPSRGREWCRWLWGQ